jgi:Ca-activated chloride channel family protein
VSFGTPLALLGLLAVPLLVAAAVARARRARRFALRFPAAGTLAAAAAGVSPWRSRLPAILALAALTLLVIGAARPRHTVHVAVQQARIMLVTDHSGSMDATDVDPTRLAAAEGAANSFLDKVPDRVKVGIVAYSAAPDDVQGPTTDHDAVRRVIARQVADGATATGDALQVALGLLGNGVPKDPSAIVLLSDGATTAGRDPVGVARQAGRWHIPIYTVALGTADATVPNPDPFGPPLDAAPDPETLRQIAKVSGARAFTATDRDQLSSIYRSLGSRLGTHAERREATVVFVVAGLVLLLAASGLSVASAGRVP